MMFFVVIVDWLKQKWTWIKWIGLGLLIALLIGCIYRLSSMRDEIKVLHNNELALHAENDSLTYQSIEYALTIEQLEYLNDSISLKLNKTLEDLKIEKKRVSQIQYIETITEVHDSIHFRDTIFVKDISIDTTLTDNKWYFINLKLNYPNVIEVSPSFNDEYYVITERKKQIVGAPKKCFIARWFQKRQTVEISTIYSESPYNKTKNYRAVKIVK